MTTLFLLLSAICGMITFGIHLSIMAPDNIDKPMYTYNPALCAIPVASGLVLPAIALIYAFTLHWIILVLISLIVVLVFARHLGSKISSRLWRNKNLGYKVFYLFVATIISLAIGITLHYTID